MDKQGLEEVGKCSRKQTFQDVARESLNVAVLVPSYSGFWPYKFGECLANMVQHFQSSEYEGEHEITVFAYGGRVMPEIKHRLIGDAISWGATHILFLMPELSFPPDSIHRMLARGRAIVGVNYLRDYASKEYSAYRAGMPVSPDPKLPEVEEVDGVAMGMVLMNMPVFDVLDLPFFKNDQIGDTPGFEEDHVSFWKQCKEKELACVIDHKLSQEVKSLHHGELWH